MLKTSRQLAAIMFTDIVGYTAMMGIDSNKTLELVRLSKHIQKPLVEQHNGLWLKEMGDGAMVQFGSALDAVNCALEIQRASRADFDADLRIGIHLGDITIENNDVYGDGVNVAARLESIADPGGIYISESIEKAIRGQSDVQAKYLGEVNLKNVDYGVRTYALQGVGLPVPDLKKDKELSGRIFAEIKRRGVIRAGIMYVLISMLLVLLQPFTSTWITFPDGFSTMLLTVLGFGFPIAVLLAWQYERSPDGFVRTSSPQSWQSRHSAAQKKPFTSNIFISILLLALLGQFAYNKFWFNGSIVTSNIEKSIAVLPFRNDSPNEENLFFCNGIMEGILDHLAKIPDLNLVSGTSVEQYRANRPSIAKIGRELNVNYILEGSVLRIGDRTQINARLIYALEDKHLWGDQYNENIENVEILFDVLAEVTQIIAGELQARISPELLKRIESVPTSDLTAYDFYLQGNEFYDSWRRTRHESDLDNANRLFQKAINRDTTFARAYVGKANVFRVRNFNKSFLEENFLDSVPIYCDEAIKLNPGLAEAYFNRGEYYKSINNIENAESDLKRALVLNPNYDRALGRLSILYYENIGDYITPLKLLNKGMKIVTIPYNRSQGFMHFANIYRNIGDWEKSLFYFQKEKELNPGANHIYWNYIVQGKFRKALEVTEGDPRKDVNSPFYLSQIGFIYLLLGEYDQAVQHFEKWEEVINEKNLSRFTDISNRIRYGLALIGTGRKEQGIAMMKDQLHQNDQIIDLGKGNYSPFYDNAGICSFLGDTERAIEYLRKYDETSFWKLGTIYFIQVDPLFDNIRDNPGYQEMVNKVVERNTNIRKEIARLETAGEL
jgi:class 3 adenylate cyclase/TolB-like protein